MSQLPLDARAILHYLNELGFKNITAEQLKEFLKDLRKLIKYESRYGVNCCPSDNSMPFPSQPKISNSKNFRQCPHKAKRQPDRNKNEVKLSKQKSSQYFFTLNKENAEGESTEEEEKEEPPTTVSTSSGRSTLSSLNTSSLPVKKKELEAFVKRFTESNNQRLNELEQRLRQIQITCKIVQSPEDTKENDKENVKSGPSKTNLPSSKTRLKASDSKTIKNMKNMSNKLVSRQPSAVSLDDTPPPPTYVVPSKKKNVNVTDPVALYHYYQQEWSHFKSRIPESHLKNAAKWDEPKKNFRA